MFSRLFAIFRLRALFRMLQLRLDKTNGGRSITE